MPSPTLSSKTTIVVSVVAVAIGLFVATNPFLFGISTGVKADEHFVYEKHEVLDHHLGLVKSYIPDDDYERYRNHCLRAMSFAKWHMPGFVYRQYPNAMDLVGMAIAYHDVALWTDGELNYLAPSIKQMEKHAGNGYSKEEIAIAREIIDQHHKVTDFSGGNRTNETFDAIVNAVRKADWADATFGVVRFGLPSSLLEAAYAKVPERGFHQMLAEFGHRLSPDSKIGELKVLGIPKL